MGQATSIDRATLAEAVQINLNCLDFLNFNPTHFKKLQFLCPIILSHVLNIPNWSAEFKSENDMSLLHGV